MSESPLAGVLTELGWKPEILARRLNGFAALHGRGEQMHVKTPYKWLGGGQPRSPWAALAAALLSDELGRVVLPADLGWDADRVELVSAISGLVLPWTVAGSLRATRVVTDAVSMERRIFLTLLGTGATAPAHEWLIAHPVDAAALSRSSSGSVVPVTRVDRLDVVAVQLSRMDDQSGGGSLLPLIRACLRHVFELLDQGRYTDEVGKRLYAAAAELMRLAGWSAWERGHHPQAQRYWVGALHAAHTAGDRAVGANVVGLMSLQARNLGQIRESVTLAETARAGYPGASPRIAALLDLRTAEAHATDRAVTECRRALDSAFDRLSDPPSSSGEPHWCYWVDEAHAHGAAGSCYLDLGDWGRARRHLGAALRLEDPGYARDGAFRRIRLATTYLRQDRPEVDHAVALATRAVETLTGEVDSPYVAGQLAQFIGQLAPYRRRPAVRQLTDQAAGLLAKAGS
ncbi:MAG: hypothetical protein ACRDTF_05850 [Pseudonocardiaceae bacterium]